MRGFRWLGSSLAISVLLLVGGAARSATPTPAPSKKPATTAKAPAAAKRPAAPSSSPPAAPAPAPLFKIADPALLRGGVEPKAAELIASIGDAYAGCSSYHFEGATHMTMSGEAGEQSLDVPFRLAAVKPAKTRTEVLNPVMSLVSVSDGSQSWTYVPQASQYTHKNVAPINQAGSTNAEIGAMLAAGTPIQRYVKPAEGLVAARIRGEATLELNGKPARCTVLQAQYSVPDSLHVQMSPSTMWVDAASKLIVRDSMSVVLPGPSGEPVKLVSATTFRTARVNGPVDDSLFRFTPPANAKLVDEIGAPGTPERVSPLVGKPAEDFSLRDLTGKTQRLGALRGKVVLLDFWATWCGPCRREMPTIAKLHRQLSGKGLAVVAVNVGEPGATVSGFLKKYDYGVPVWLDTTTEIADRYGATAIPTLVVIDRQGKVVEHTVGVHDEASLRAMLKKAGLQI